jgi:hypothetical protein
MESPQRGQRNIPGNVTRPSGHDLARLGFRFGNSSKLA